MTVTRTAKPTSTNVSKLITRFSVGASDFAPTKYSVPDFSDTSEVVKVEKLRRWDEATQAYYESLGYTVLEVQETDHRWLKWDVTMSHTIHQSKTFTSYGAAAAYVRANFDRLWTAYHA